MPFHVFQPSRNPPRWWDRLLVHPLDMTVAVVAVIFGVLVIASLFIPEFIPSKSMDKMSCLETSVTKLHEDIDDTQCL